MSRMSPPSALRSSSSRSMRSTRLRSRSAAMPPVLVSVFSTARSAIVPLRPARRGGDSRRAQARSMTGIGLGERGLLFGARLLLVLRLPLLVGHAVDDLARIRDRPGRCPAPRPPRDTSGSGSSGRTRPGSSCRCSARRSARADAPPGGGTRRLPVRCGSCRRIAVRSWRTSSTCPEHGASGAASPYWRGGRRESEPWPGTMRAPARRSGRCSTRRSRRPIRARCWRRICRRSPTGRCVVVGCGKSAAVMAAALEDAWPDVALEGTVVTRYGHAVPTQAHRGDRGLASGARRQQRARRAPAAGARARPGPGRSGARADLGRRFGAVRRAGAGPDAGRQAGDQPRAARVGREHYGNELRAQASVGDQGRPAGRRRPPGARGDAGDQRCAGRRSGGDRLGADGAGSHHLRRCARDHCPLRHQAVRGGRRTAGAGRRRDAEAGRTAEQRIPPDRHADDGADTGWRTARARWGWRRWSWAMRWKAKSREMGIVHGGHRPQHPHAWPAARAAGGDAVRAARRR